MRRPRLLLLKAIPAGARWITIHPNGPDAKGQAVLIQPQADGSARVIGGAGGKLNYLKLKGVRSEADYRDDVRNKAKERAAVAKEQRARDKADGLAPSKAAAKQAVRDQLREHEKAFVSAVSDAMGWTEDQTRFPEENFQNATPEEQAKAAKEHAKDLFRRAQDAVETQRQRLLIDADARSEAGLGEVPLVGATDDQVTVQDLDPVAPATKGFGFSTDYSKRAEAAGLTKGELEQEAAASQPEKPKRAMAAKVRDELKAIRDPGPKVDPAAVVDARRAVEMLKAQKLLKAVKASAREKSKQISEADAPVEPKAYVIEAKEATDADIAGEVESDLRTIKTRAFLDEVGKIDGGSDSLGRHIGVGAFNSINSLALATTGASLLDRSTVDVLGIAGAAQVLARRLQATLTPEELDQAREAMGRFHVEHYMELSDKALREARDWRDLAQEIELDDAATGADLARAQEMNAKRRDFTQNAQEVLGTALGEMESNAALVAALGRPKHEEVQASLGKTSVEDAITQARAIGLERGEYSVTKAGPTTMLTVHAAGMDRLAKPVDRADLEHVRGALDIIEGRADEDGWLPKGVADRADMATNPRPGVAPRLAKPFAQKPADMEAAVRDYIGGRTADGDPAADVLAGLLSEDTLQRAGDRSAFMAAVDRVAPLYDGEGTMVRAETHQGAFEKMADAFVAQSGGDRSPLHRQNFPVDDVAVDALHRALAAHPDGVAAFKPIGELTPQDQGALRKVFAREYGRTDPAAEGLRADLERLDASEPEKETQDMFGTAINPEWRDWQTQRNETAEKLGKASMTWGKYIETMGSPAAAYTAMQDVVRSQVLRKFADQHNALRPDAALKIGRTPIANDLAHLDALDPQAREVRLADHRQRVDSLRSRVAGRYAAGGVAEKLDAARAADEAASQAQMGFFGGEDLFGGGGSGGADEAPAEPEKPLQLGERYTIGHAAERQIAGMMPIVGSQFRAGQPVHLWRPDMSGKYVGRQRAIKLIKHNKRAMLGLGVGSGKTSISLAAFTDLHAEGKAKRGLFVVPSIVQGQFHGEALTLLQPGKYNWHADPSASREQRIAAYKNPGVHFNVVTHQAFRDDVLHLASKRDGISQGEVSAKLAKMKPDARQAYMRELLDSEGIDHDYLAVDEGHNLLNRQGKENSDMANVSDAVSDGMPYYVNMTADPVKNDSSEAFDVLAKMDRNRYSDRAAFMRKYGVNTPAAKDGLRREMVRHFYTGKIDPGIEAHQSDVQVELGAHEKQRLETIESAGAKARLARMQGKVDVPALQQLSPGSFEGVDPAQHEAVGKQLNKSLGIVLHGARNRAINGPAKIGAAAKMASDRKGRPGVVFARSLENVQQIAERLKADGHKVVTLTGGDSSSEKDRKKRAYQAGEHDIMVASDAAAVGANLQRGKWLAQFDTPDTAMLHAQRDGRINRTGQTEDVELLNIIANHPVERRRRQRLADKYDLRDIMTSPLEGLDDHGIAGMLQKVRAEKAEGQAGLF